MKWFQQRLKELKVSILFLTRLPAGAVKGNIPKIADIIWTFPIVGFLVGLIIGLSCFGLQWAGLSPVLSSILAVFIGILITGALHEDGLADSADGFGGGQGTLNKLEIMRDSRIGSYGVLALILALAARVFALSDLPITYQSIILIICIAMVSRLAMACYLFWLPPAREDGLGHQADVTNLTSILAAAAFCLPAIILSGDEILWVLIGIFLVAFSFGILAKKQVGGQTGDVCGAGQVLSETTGLIVLTLIIANPTD